jgi:ferredoxin
VYRIEIDRSLCSGFGSCIEHAPHNVRLGADGLAELTSAQAADHAILEAAASCPMGAITVLDDDGNQAA